MIGFFVFPEEEFARFKADIRRAVDKKLDIALVSSLLQYGCSARILSSCLRHRSIL